MMGIMMDEPFFYSTWKTDANGGSERMKNLIEYRIIMTIAMIQSKHCPRRICHEEFD